jgi:hypothetical protein
MRAVSGDWLSPNLRTFEVKKKKHPVPTINMNKRIQIFLVLTILFGHFAIGQDFHWVRSFGSQLADHCSNVAIDNYGNSYVAGNFGYIAAQTNEGNFYETTPYLFIGGDTLMNVGFNNDYLAKYDEYGNLIWAISIGGLNEYDNLDRIGGLAYDSVSDHLYIAGTGTGEMVIGTVEIPCTNSDVFIAKFDLNGTCIWGKNFIGSGIDLVRDMCVDPSGNIYLTGQNPAPMTIQSISVEDGGYIAKFDSSGSCLWAKKEFTTLSTPGNVNPMSISATNDDIIVGGSTTAPALMVDTLQISDSNYNGSYNYYAGLLAKFDNLGRLRWAKLQGSPCSEIKATDIDPAGDIYTAGWFMNTCFFDTLSLQGSGGFIVKYDPSGGIIFLNKSGSTGKSSPDDMKSDNTGNCYVTGTTNGPVTFGETTFTSDGAFLVKYLSDGTAVWAKQIKSYAMHNELAVSLNSEGSVITLAGAFSTYISIDSSITIYNSGSSQYGAGDLFVARYDNSVGIEETNASAFNSLTIFPNPTTGYFNINIPLDFQNEHTLTLSMINQLGNTVHQENIAITGEMITENLKNLSDGFYIVSVSNGSKKYFGKLILR